MKTTKKNSGIKVTTNVKAGGWNPNHARRGLKIASAIKAGTTWSRNHTRALLAA
jgi:hypothetical protein